MARLRQQYPQNYSSSGNIHGDFENIVRYLNSAELGNKTLSELLATLFNDEGEFDGPIEFRLNTSTGLEYRVGEYRNEEDGWILLADIEDLRGPAGQNLGIIEGPLFFNRQDVAITVDNTTEIEYTFDDTVEDVAVYKNGILLRGTGVDPEYETDSDAGTITLTTGNEADDGDTVTVYSIRAGAVSNYRRTDYIAPSTTATIAFAHTDAEKLLVYKNGILQREGALADYVRSAANSTITFITPLVTDDVATVMTVENQVQVDVAGLMLEDAYTDGNGYILYGKLVIENDEIPQAKVNGLSAAISSKAKMTVSASAPGTPASGDLWLDTSVTPNILKFYQGTQWLAASPNSTLPNFTVSNANQYPRVNGTGTAIEYGSIDFTSLVPKTYMGAASGVASLDSSGKIPTSQLPEIFSVDTAHFKQSGAISNTTYYAHTIYKQKIRIDGLTAILSSGTCTVQIAVDGSGVGSTFAVSSTRTNQDINPVIEVDATTVGKEISIIVTSNSSGNDLRVGLSIATLST